ncbi:MAG: tetratricopeptide repeat protein, partial [Gemmatimonadota bacterium]|nr:tetratricopeptide repeat protein [Gemmatimonadota bacterium]
GDRDLPLRQRTLRTTISWSYSLLDAQEQRLLRRLSVFHDGWTLKAMEQVCYPDDERYRALDELESLVEKGLVRVIGSGERYGLLETIRAFAAEQLHAEGSVDEARRAHADHFVNAAVRIGADFKTPQQLDAMKRARDENANTLAAVQCLGTAARAGDDGAIQKGLLLCGNLLWPWHINGQHLTALAEVGPFLDLAEGRPASEGRVLSLLIQAMSLSSTGDWDGHLRDANKALQDAEELGDDALVAEALLHTGYVLLSTGRLEEARAALADSVKRAERSGAEFMHALGLSIESMCVFLLGDLPAGVELAESALRIQRRIGDYEGRGLALSFLAQMSFAQGDHAGAMERFDEALQSFGTVGDRPEMARLYCEMGWAALGAQDNAEARASFVRAVRAYEEVGSPRGTGMALMGLAAVDAAEGLNERAVTIAAAAEELSARAGVVVEHPMDPQVAERIESLKAAIPQGALAGLEAEAKELTPAAVLGMVAA